MYLPCFVLPYQRSPSRWNTLVSVLTQTMPGAAGAGAIDWVPCAAGEGAALFALPIGGAPTVTSGEISSIWRLETPARLRSATDEYGRPAMIFFTVAGPMPGSLSSSAGVAVLRST